MGLRAWEQASEVVLQFGDGAGGLLRNNGTTEIASGGKGEGRKVARQAVPSKVVTVSKVELVDGRLRRWPDGRGRADGWPFPLFLYLHCHVDCQGHSDNGLFMAHVH